MRAAESLVDEVDDRREDLAEKLRDRNREIRKLQNLVQQGVVSRQQAQLKAANKDSIG